MKSAAVRPDWEGRTLDGKFALLERIGGSLKGSVFLTLRQGAQKAAVKIIPAEEADADAYLAHWAAAKALSHPYLMPLFEAGRSTLDGTSVVYVVTKFAEHDLARAIQDEALTPHAARDIFRPILDALSYAHAEGFIHGHVKPSKILLVEGKWTLSGDEFLAVEDGAGKPKSHPNICDAPEVAAGKFSEATDIWRLGMTLAEALTQHAPTLNGNKMGEPHVPESLPEPFFDIVSACLRSDPEKRCTLDEIRREFATIPSRAFDAYPTPIAAIYATSDVASTARAADPIPAVPEPASVAQPTTDATDRGVLSNPPCPSPTMPDPIPAVPERVFPASEPSPSAETAGPVASPPEPPAAETPSGEFEGDTLGRTGVPVVPIVLGLVVVIAFATVLVLRNDRPQIPSTNSTRDMPSSASPAVSRPEAPPALPDQGPGSPSPAASAARQPMPSQAAPPSETGETVSKSLSETVSPSQTQKSAPPQSHSTFARGKPNAPTRGEAPQKADQASSMTAANAPGRVQEEVLPDVSQNARHGMREPVEVIIGVSVDRNGAVKNASYISPDEGNYFARTAVRAAHLWKFTPPERNGRAQPSAWTLHFTFSVRKTWVEATEDER